MQAWLSRPFSLLKDTAMSSKQSTVKAAAWMMLSLSLLLLLLMSVSGRVVTHELNVFQAMEMRSVIAFFILLPLVYREGGLREMRTSIPLRHIGRNVAHYLGQYAWLLGLTLIPLAQSDLDRIHCADLGRFSGRHVS